MTLGGWIRKVLGKEDEDRTERELPEEESIFGTSRNKVFVSKNLKPKSKRKH